MNRTLFHERVLFLLALLLLSFDGYAAVGVVQFAAGDVQIRDAAGVVRPARKGDAINEGDTILSGPGASAQLKMSDNGILAVRPETELKIETYKFSGKEDGTEHALMSLVKGGFRTITGVIGRTHKDNYKINTLTATIGIRGTDHEPHVIPAVVAGVGKPVAPAGTYDKVNVGQAYIATPQGSVNINPNQVGFAAANQAPRLLPAIPGFFKATPPIRSAQEQKEAEKQKQAAQQKGEQKQAGQEKEQQTAQTKQAAAQTGGQSTESQGTPAPAKAADTPAPTVAAASSEVRSSSTVDPGALTAPTSATTVAAQTVTPTTAVTTPTGGTTAAPPAVVQNITGTTQSAGSSETPLNVDFTKQTVSDNSGTTAAIDTVASSGGTLPTPTPTPTATPTPAPTPAPAPTPTSSSPVVVSSNYAHVVMGQVQGTSGPQILAIGNAYSQTDSSSTHIPNNNTDYVLDSGKSLVEIKHSYYSPPFDPSSSSSQSGYFADADVKFSGGTASNQASDPNNSIYIGRVTGGQISATDNATTNPLAPATQDLGSSSFHWLVGVEPGMSSLTNSLSQPIANTQLLTGTANFSLLAATAPTDSAGHIGTLNSATTTANFTSMTTDTALNLSFAAGRTLTLAATSKNAPIKGNQFMGWAYSNFPSTGSLTSGTIDCTGDCPAGGYFMNLTGTFVGAASGGTTSGGVGNALGLSYGFSAMNTSTATSTSFTDLIQGVAILSTAAAPTAGVTNFAAGSTVRREVLWTTSSSFGTGGVTTTYMVSDKNRETLTNNLGGTPTTPVTISGPNTNTNYLFDSNGNLVRVFDTPHVVFDHGSDVQAGSVQFAAQTPLAHAQLSFGGGGSSARSFYDPNTQIRLGSWTGGLVNTTDLITEQSYVESLAVPGSTTAQRSLQWVIAQEPSSLPVTGVYVYSRIKDGSGNNSFATAPTDSYGNVGTLDRARLTADFNRMRVSAGVSVSINSGTGGSLGMQTVGGNFADAPIGAGGGFNVSSNPADNPGYDWLHVSCAGPGCAPNQTYGGRIRGGFSSATGGAGTADGGFFRYTFNTNYGSSTSTVPTGRLVDDYITGIVSFTQGGTTPIQIVAPSQTAAVPSNVLTTYSYNVSSAVGTTRQRVTGQYSPSASTSIATDSAGNLMSVTDDSESSNPSSLTITGGTGTVFQASSYATNGITYGWRSNSPTMSLSGSDYSSPSFLRTPLNDGLSWVKGPAVYPFYLPGAISTISNASGIVVNGTATFNLDGAIVHDQAGNPLSGVTASLGVDFNRQAVGFDINVPAGTGTGWVANSLGGGAANPAIRMDGDGAFYSSTGGEANTPSVVTTTHRGMSVTFNGSPAFGNLNGQLMGAGVTGAGIAFDFGSNTGDGANGALAFTNSAAPYSVLTPYRIGGIVPGMNDLGLTFPEENYRIMGGPMARGRIEMDANGVPIKFDADMPVSSVPSGCSTCTPNLNHIPVTYAVNGATGVASVGTATLVDFGADPATGLIWGRYAKDTNGVGTIGVNDRISGASLGTVAPNAHFIVGPQQSGPTVLPITGTFTYTPVGNTSPTDNLGNVGVLNSATLTANFATQKVDTALALTVAGSSWNASASGVAIQKGAFFEAGKKLGAATGPLTITRTGETNPANLAGKITGAFTGTTGQGAALLYSLNHGGNAASTAILRGGGTTVSGVVGFKR